MPSVNHTLARNATVILHAYNFATNPRKPAQTLAFAHKTSRKFGLGHRGFLDRQHVTTCAARPQPLRRARDHLLRPLRVEKETGQVNFARPILAQPPHPYSPTTGRNQMVVQEDPLFPGDGRQTAPAKPSSCRASRVIRETESEFTMIRKPRCVNTVGKGGKRARASLELFVSTFAYSASSSRASGRVKLNLAPPPGLASAQIVP